MAQQPIIRLEELQVPADRAVDCLGSQGENGWEVATWSSDDSATRYFLGRSAMHGPFNSYFLRIDQQTSGHETLEPSIFSFTNITHEVDIKGPAADEFKGLGFPDSREAAKKAIIGHLLTAPVILPAESLKPLEYIDEANDEFVKIVVNEVSYDPTMEALVTLVWGLEQKEITFDTEKYWDLAEETDDLIAQRYGLDASAFNEAYHRCRIRLWEEGKIKEIGETPLT